MIGAALLLLAPAATTAPDYPVREVLEAFATACAATEDTATNGEAAAAAGWQPLAADADEPVVRLAREGLDALRAQTPGAQTLGGGEYRKIVAGRTLFLAISGVRANDVTARGCRVYDFAAPRAPTADELAAWSGRPAEPALAHRGVTKYAWSPGLKPGHADMQVIYAPPGSRPAPGFETGGLALVASALEF